MAHLHGRPTGGYQALDLGPVDAPAAGARGVDDARFRAPYEGGSRFDPDLAGWDPYGWSGQGAISDTPEDLSNRINDLARNNGWTSTGLQRVVDTLVGGGWILIAQPNARTLGLTDDQAAELAADIEALWDDDSSDPDCWFDRERTLPFGLQTALAMRHRIREGEAFGVIGYRDRGGPCATFMGVVDPARCSTPIGQVDGPRLQKGVELGAIDADPIAYHFTVGHPGDTWASNGDSLRWVRVEREIPAIRRRQVVHAFEPSRAGERRGVSSLAPIVKPLRKFGLYDDAEVSAASLNAIMAAFVTSPQDHEQLARSLAADGPGLSDYQDARLAHNERHPLRLGAVKARFLFPGEDVKLTQPGHPNTVYEMFVRTCMRNLAGCFGLTYEQFTGDLSQVNYSSIRAGLIEIKKGFDARKTHFAGMWMQPFYAAWLQEALERGRIKVPGSRTPSFLEAKSAWCGAEWIGPGQGWVDPLKEAQAVRERLALKLTTRRREIAALGARSSQVFSEARREEDDMRAMGLDPAVAPSSSPASDGSADEAGEGAAPTRKKAA